jgi:hypothetical protein
VIAGVLLTGLFTPDHAVHMFTNPARGEFAFLVPLGGTRFRCYSGFYRQHGRRWLSGGRSIVDFVASSVAIGAPREWFERRWSSRWPDLPAPRHGSAIRTAQVLP